MADQLHGEIPTGETQCRVWHLLAAGYEKGDHCQTVYVGKYSVGRDCLRDRDCGRHSSAAGLDGGYVLYGTDGISSADQDRRRDVSYDGLLLWQLLSAGAYVLQAEI